MREFAMVLGLLLLGLVGASCSSSQGGGDASTPRPDAATDGTRSRDLARDLDTDGGDGGCGVAGCEADCSVVKPGPGSAIARGGRRLGVALTLPGDNPGRSLAWAHDRAAALGGGQVVELNIDWARIETGPGQRVDPDGELAAADVALRDAEAIHLNIAPFQTTYDARPEHLKPLGWDDPKLAAAYRDAIAFVLDKLPALEAKVTHVMVGNELELDTPERWQAYADFLVAVYAGVKSLFASRSPGMAVTTSVKLALGVARSPAVEPWAAAIWALGDWVNVTYYPLTDAFATKAPTDLSVTLGSFLTWVDQQQGLGPTKPVLLSEVGYPSSSLLAPPGTSGLCNQARFVSEAFSFWDSHRARIPALTFVWLADLSDVQVGGLLESYGLTSPPLEQALVDRISAFFRTLGLLDAKGGDKPATEQLKLEACARGWIGCPD